MRCLPYGRYKATGIEWLREIPEHWKLASLRHIAQMKAGEAITADQIDETGTYPVYGGNGLRGFSEHFTHEGDLVLIGRQGALCGNINLASGRFWASEHAIVGRPEQGMDSRWLGELLGAMNLAQYSMAAAQPGLSVDNLRPLQVPLPPTEEQKAIATFLDHETARIDTLIEKKRRLIELLQEKRTALISRVVTRGLPPDAGVAAGREPHPKLKPSGVEWLGDVPEHWEIEKFSRAVAIAEGQVHPEDEPYASMLLIAPNHVESGTGRVIARETASEQAAISGKYFCRAGDVIYSKIRPALAKVTIALEDCLCSADMYPMSGRGSLRNRYLFWLLLSPEFTAWSVLEADRVAMPKINRETLSELRLPVPPCREQDAIARYLEDETAKLQRMIDRVETAATTLRDYRAALVTAAVTGKIDVRNYGS